MTDHKTVGESPEQNDGPKYVLTLFVAGEGHASSTARENLERICRDNLSGRYEIEVVDITENPAAAEEADIIAVPTLIRNLPPPLRKVVGDFSEPEKVLVGLELESVGNVGADGHPG